jgi:predicted dehydrogenase
MFFLSQIANNGDAIMSLKSPRRTFLKTCAASTVGYWAAGGVHAAESKSPNEKIRIASFGVGGKGTSDIASMQKAGADIVALCDIDRNRLKGAKGRYAKTVEERTYTDFRKCLEENEKRIDAVTVTTPDHNHAVISAMAMRMGKHCFTQKPLTHDLYEARHLAELARKMKVATQMGNQGTANNGAREAAAIVRAGGLGTPQEIHIWTTLSKWPQGGPRPASSAVPAQVDWQSWIGSVAMRPYGGGYHPFSWRGWWDFGTGRLGDQGCHIFNMPFWACDLANPVAATANSSKHNRDSYPTWSTITYEFAKTDWRPAIKLYWYDGGKLPPRDLFKGGTFPQSSGVLIVGDKGKLVSAGPYAPSYSLFGGATKPAGIKYDRSPGHVQEWFRAMRGGPPAASDFGLHAGPLTETVLLGNLALWGGGRIEWDSKTLKAKGKPDLDRLIKRPYRKGYSLEG